MKSIFEKLNIISAVINENGKLKQITGAELEVMLESQILQKEQELLNELDKSRQQDNLGETIILDLGKNIKYLKQENQQLKKEIERLNNKIETLGEHSNNLFAELLDANKRSYNLQNQLKEQRKKIEDRIKELEECKVFVQDSIFRGEITEVIIEELKNLLEDEKE